MSLPDVKDLKTTRDYEKFVKLKMEMVATISKQYRSVSLLGIHINVYQ
jgi:hypothetical protein